MKGDFTRSTFRSRKHYRGVLMQQGRVQLDADWNEQQDITAHRIETEALDVIGQSGVPAHDAGFGITPASGGDFTIGAGRMYVDGILCENDDDVPYTQQPDLPAAPALGTAGRYFAYLDVWERHVTALDDPSIREVALGGPDTATRAKTVWQVKTLAVGATDGCATAPQAWLDATAPSTGMLSARATPAQSSSTPCIIPPGAGYRRLENQLYRVEIHAPGVIGAAGTAPTFKWSRDNGSVAAAIKSIATDTITLTGARLDSATGFAPDQWIEITDDRNDLLGVRGMLARITKVEDLVLTIDLATAIPTPLVPAAPDMTLHPKVRRWDSEGETTVSIPAGNGGFLPLEDGVEVRFENGTYKTGDYWMIPARTDKGTVEWPVAAGVPTPLPADGILHHYALLAVLDCTTGPVTITVVEDCRKHFPPLTEVGNGGCCCTYTVSAAGDGNYATIHEAVAALPATGGVICVAPGVYTDNVVIANMRNVTIRGCGVRSRVVSAAPDENATTAAPVFWISRSRNIKIEELAIAADPLGVGILVDTIVETTTTGTIDQFKTNADAVNVINASTPRVTATEICFTRLDMTAARQSAIEVHGAVFATISDCVIQMLDASGFAPAIFFEGELGEIRHNFIAGAVQTAVVIRGDINFPVTKKDVTPIAAQTKVTAPAAPAEVSTKASMKASTKTSTKTSARAMAMAAPDVKTTTQAAAQEKVILIHKSSATTVTAATNPGAGGVSGIQLGGGSERVRVVDNWIQNVSGQGVTLGNINEVDANGTTTIIVGWTTNPADPCDPCNPPVLVTHVITNESTGSITRTSAGDLYEIEIVANHIRGTGLDGIGVAGFFDLRGADEFISVHLLLIEDNDIRECLRRSLAPTTALMADSMGYGGIALADVESLTIRGNVIEDNAVNQPTPACGIFVLHGEGIDITDNHLLNNGRSITAEENTLLGRRGGINIVYAVSPQIVSAAAFTTGTTDNTFATRFTAPAPGGFPAAAIHGNIVDAPLGRALTVVALGPVSVLDNQFSTRDVVPGSPFTFFNPATVLIGNLGVSNEVYGQLLLFKTLNNDPKPQQGFDDLGLGRYLANGNVLFADNQCSLNLIGGGMDVAFSSITIFSLDDVAIRGNQSDCNMVPRQDFVITDVFAFATSLRMSANRFKEGVLNAVLSGWTIGLLNQTIDNQATHCIIAQGPAVWLVNKDNTILISALLEGYCGESLRNTLGTFSSLNQKQGS